jgi:nicotinamidase-related amidase
MFRWGVYRSCPRNTWRPTGSESTSAARSPTLSFASAFFGTSTASIFTSRGVDTVIVTGSTTSGCVRASAVDALQSGFRVVIPRECVADRAPGPHEASLFDLHAKYADVVALDELLALLAELPAARLEDQ